MLDVASGRVQEVVAVASTFDSDKYLEAKGIVTDSDTWNGVVSDHSNLQTPWRVSPSRNSMWPLRLPAALRGVGCQNPSIDAPLRPSRASKSSGHSCQIFTKVADEL